MLDKIFSPFSLLAICLLFSCQREKPRAEDTTKTVPQDYFYAQRAFPYQRVDRGAYRRALAERRRPAFFRSADPAYRQAWELRGPRNVGGRITDIEMPPDDLSLIYAGSASGGVFRSRDGGKSFVPIFDQAASLSIGDLALAPSQPEILYVGTGEANAGGGSLAYDGYGVYKSANGGETWTHLGLENAGSIGRIMVSHQDPDVAYVAAMGALFSNTGQRGVFRTTDGGQSWQQSLYLNDSTGLIDLAIHPRDHNTVYAATWERIRRPHRRSYGGASSGIYKTTDGGRSWRELRNGLPSAPAQKGRIGLALAPSNPDIVYAYYVDRIGYVQGIYRSADAGDSWQPISTSGLSNVSFGWWFGRITVSPDDPNLLYATSLRMHRSRPGFSGWEEIFANSHVDHHALFIHPQNPELVINGNDGGIYLSNNRGDDHTKVLDLPNNQFYTCTIDPNDPRQLYGGMQDNGTYRSTPGSDEPWEKLFGGDGFQIDVEPGNSEVFYLQSQYGTIMRTLDGGQRFEYVGVGGNNNWNTPLTIHPRQPRTIYTGNQRLYRSDDRGDSWRPISPSLVNADNPGGNIIYGTLTCIELSPLDPEVIYVGTDDGHVWVSHNGGGDWQSISAGLPKRWITGIYADRNRPEVVYVSVSGFRFGESSAQVFRSEDRGATWQAIGRDLPDVPVNDIIADPLYPGRLFLATDIGVFYSLDDGQRWQPLGSGLPLAPVTDIDLHPISGLLVAATYGRSMYSYSLPGLATQVESPAQPGSWSLYPNPADTYIFVSGIDCDISIDYRIHDMQGRIMMAGKTKPEQGISVQELPSGTYLLQLERGRERMAFRMFMKK